MVVGVLVVEGRGRYMLKDLLLGLLAMDWRGVVGMDNPIATKLLWLLWQKMTIMAIVATSDDNEVRG